MYYSYSDEGTMSDEDEDEDRDGDEMSDESHEKGRKKMSMTT
jgi:hypothetical protein